MCFAVVRSRNICIDHHPATQNARGNTAAVAVERALRFVTALLDFTLLFPFPTHLGPLDLYLDSHRTIANTHGSPLHCRNSCMSNSIYKWYHCRLFVPKKR
jgi:hypothetical protein